MPEKSVTRSGRSANGGLELFLANLPSGAAADREVRVQQGRRRRGGDTRGEPVRPAAVAAAPVRIVEAFRGAVADGDVARKDRCRSIRSADCGGFNTRSAHGAPLAFSSSNQFRTTCISRGGASGFRQGTETAARRPIRRTHNRVPPDLVVRTAVVASSSPGWAAWTPTSPSPCRSSERTALRFAPTTPESGRPSSRSAA